MDANSCRKRGQRIIALVLCFVLLFTSIPAIAFSESRNTEEEPVAEQENVQYEEQNLSHTLILEEDVSEENAVLEESSSLPWRGCPI